jgi:ketosteroid isomerase-like protein
MTTLQRAGSLAAFTLFWTIGVPAQPTPPDQIVKQWIDRWNAIGAGPEAIDAVLALYEPDALHITGPSPDQRGTATYRGHDGLRVLLNRIAATEERLGYRIETETAREETAQLMHATTGPWGGPAVAVQLVAVSTDIASKKRYATPGAAFFQFANGKIRRARVYFADGERAEVEAETTRRRPQ